MKKLGVKEKDNLAYFPFSFDDILKSGLWKGKYHSQGDDQSSERPNCGEIFATLPCFAIDPHDPTPHHSSSTRVACEKRKLKIKTTFGK